MRRDAFSANETSGVDTRTAVLSILGFWVVWLVLVTARAAAMGWPDQGGMLLRRLAMAALGVMLAWIVHRLLEAGRHWRLPVRAASALLLSVPATIVFAVVSVMVFYRWFPVASVAADLARWEPRAVIVTAVADGLVTWYFFFAAWAAFYLALGFIGAVRASSSRCVAKQCRSVCGPIRLPMPAACPASTTTRCSCRMLSGLR